MVRSKLVFIFGLLIFFSGAIAEVKKLPLQYPFELKPNSNSKEVNSKLSALGAKSLPKESKGFGAFQAWSIKGLIKSGKFSPDAVSVLFMGKKLAFVHLIQYANSCEELREIYDSSIKYLSAYEFPSKSEQESKSYTCDDFLSGKAVWVNSANDFNIVIKSSPMKNRYTISLATTYVPHEK